jgi:hypothetical protein
MIWITRIDYRTIFSLGGRLSWGKLHSPPVNPRGGGFNAAVFSSLIAGHCFNFFWSSDSVLSGGKGKHSSGGAGSAACAGK